MRMRMCNLLVSSNHKPHDLAVSSAANAVAMQPAVVGAHWLDTPPLVVVNEMIKPGWYDSKMKPEIAFVQSVNLWHFM